jgi:GTP cyclohydrolase II
MVPTEVPSREQNIRYLQTKKDRMDHLLVLDVEPAPAAGLAGFEQDQD